MSTYILSAKARLDLQLIWNHVAAESIDAADKVKHELRHAMEQLSQMPGMGHRRSDVQDPRFRFWPIYSYLIAYYPDTRPLQVVRVVHGSRDMRRLFRQR